jgi:transcriptional regulator of heat shock response
MGLFDSTEEKEAKKVQKEVKDDIEKTGLSNLVNEADLLKIIVEQNECLIQLAANNAISNAGMVGDILVIGSTQMYYKNIKKYFKK